MGMTPKQNHQLIKTFWKSTGEIEKDFTQNKDLQFRVCPFTIILGAINSTETGYKPPTSIPNDYTSFSKIFTGKEAIQAVWDHSYFPIQDKDNPDLAYKQLQIGDVFYGNILSDQLGITYSATPNDNSFIQEQAIKNVVINIPNESKNFNFINNIVSNLYKLYMIPEINKVINIDKSIKVDRQWYILEVASKTYNNENKELAYIQCTFSSLNDKLAHSGLAINQYVQLGSPGDPVALPALDENNNIILDSNYLTPLPVTHCQISFYGSVKLWIGENNKELYKDNPDLAYKQLQIGDVFYGNILSDQLGITYSATPNDNSFIQEQAIKNVVINIPNESKNFNFINNIVSNLYKLYMIPEINKVINIDKSIKVDRQWYILEVASKTYNNENKELAYIQCTFSSLNDKLAHSGLAINQYVQLGSPGDPVALPALDENNNIILDSNYLTPLPVTHCQISFYGSVKPISIALWGRDIDNNEKNTKQHKYRQYPSKLLFPWQYQCSTYDPVSFQALPETNYVLTVQGQSVMDSYQDWQKIIAPNYDDGATKHYEGHLRTNVEKTKNTNKVDVSNRLVNYWDNNFLNGAEIEDYNYATAGNPYFQYYNKNNKKFIGNTHYNMNNNKFKQLNTINALHYFIYNPISEIPLTVRETIKINLNTIPIFGSFMNAFVGGLDIGAKLSSNLLIPQFPYINGLISAELYNFYTTLLYSSQSTNPALIPLDVFRNETPDTIQSVLGTASHMTSFTFNLTDSLGMARFDINDNTVRSGYNKTTENLCQIDQTDKSKIFLLPDDNDINSLLKAPNFTNINIVKWAIDMIDIKVVGKSNFKITFYSMPENRNGAVNDNFSIWSGTYQTVGKASNNSRLIQNTFILANNTFKFDQPFNYPQTIQPPPLIQRANPIFIDLSNQNQYGINNNIKSDSISNYDFDYKMRPHILEDDKGKFHNSINIYVNQYGYDNIDNFKEDYESMTFNFNFNMNAIYSTGSHPNNYINNKNWFTPITIKLSDIGNFPTYQNNTALFQDNDNIYNNNSGNHNDMNNNWTFNVNNYNTFPNQTASLTNTERLNKIYINNLLWTNDTPSSGYTIPSSTWFKIMAFKTKTIDSQNDNLIIIEYQFISTLMSRILIGSKIEANWNLQTTSLVINPKSVT